jgi:type 1 fimbriae regulatory protein FimB/type 1 fimbriae regulatory protein FimE
VQETVNISTVATAEWEIMPMKPTNDDSPPTIQNLTVKRRYLTEREVERLVGCARKNRHGHRDATMVLVAYRHGLRASEVCDLQWHQIELDQGRMHVHVHPIRGDEMRALRRLRRESPHDAYVFVSERGGLSPIGFHRLIQRLGEAAKMPFSIHPHMLRHACGYKLANDGHDSAGACSSSAAELFDLRSLAPPACARAQPPLQTGGRNSTRTPRRANDLVFGIGSGDYMDGAAKAALDDWISGKRTEQLGKRAAEMLLWRIHDIRRTVATGMANIGVQPHIIEAVLNHISGHKAVIAGICNRAVYAAEKRAALERWADHLQSLIKGADNKIIAFPAHAV